MVVADGSALPRGCVVTGGARRRGSGARRTHSPATRAAGGAEGVRAVPSGVVLPNAGPRGCGSPKRLHSAPVGVCAGVGGGGGGGSGSWRPFPRGPGSDLRRASPEGPPALCDLRRGRPTASGPEDGGCRWGLRGRGRPLWNGACACPPFCRGRGPGARWGGVPGTGPAVPPGPLQWGMALMADPPLPYAPSSTATGSPSHCSVASCVPKQRQLLLPGTPDLRVSVDAVAAHPLSRRSHVVVRAAVRRRAEGRERRALMGGAACTSPTGLSGTLWRS